ncbi:MAG: radical SAM protein [Romboutsia sp.]|nr:radical SAM protein [Romboutsia sp.]
MELTEDYIFNLKEGYVKRKVDDYYVVIFKNTHKYIVLDKNSNVWFEALETGDSIGDVYKKFSLDSVEEVYLDFLSDLYWALIKNEPKEKSTEISLKFDLTYRCNTNCIHCFLPEFPNMKELNLEEWKTISNKFFNALPYKPSIAISGGEALIRNSMLKSLISYIRPKAQEITLLTNGFILSDWIEEKNADLDFYLENIDFFQISMDGFDEETYDEVRGKGKFRKIVNTIKYLNDKNKPAEYHITVSNQNMDNIEKNFVKFVKENNLYKENFNHFNISLVQPLGNAKDMERKGLLCSKLDYEKFLFRLQTNINKVFPPKFIDKNTTVNNSICSVGNQISISPNGLCYLCGVVLGEPVCNVLEDDVNDILKRFANIREKLDQKNIAECKDCELLGICTGGCRVNNKRKTGKLTTVNCTDERKEEIYFSLVREEILGVPY